MITLDKNIILSICTQLLRHRNAQVSLIGEVDIDGLDCITYDIPTIEVDMTLQRLVVEETGWSMEEFRTALDNFKDDIRDNSKCVLCGKVIDAPNPEGNLSRCLACSHEERRRNGFRR